MNIRDRLRQWLSPRVSARRSSWVAGAHQRQGVQSAFLALLQDLRAQRPHQPVASAEFMLAIVSNLVSVWSHSEGEPVVTIDVRGWTGRLFGTFEEYREGHPDATRKDYHLAGLRELLLLLNVRDPDGEAFLDFPEGTVTREVREDMWHGFLSPPSLDLTFGPALRVPDYSVDGQVTFYLTVMQEVTYLASALSTLTTPLEEEQKNRAEGEWREEWVKRQVAENGRGGCDVTVLDSPQDPTVLATARQLYMLGSRLTKQ